MSEEKFEASARRFTRITRHGLVENNAVTGETKRISQQPEDIKLGKSKTRRQLRIRRPTKKLSFAKSASRTALNASRSRLKYANTASDHTQPGVSSERVSKLHTESTKKLLRFEHPVTGMSKAQSTKSPHKAYQQKYRRMRLKQDSSVRMTAEPNQGSNHHIHLNNTPKQRLRFEHPANHQPEAQSTESPHKAYQQKHRRMRLKQDTPVRMTAEPNQRSNNTHLHNTSKQRLHFERPTVGTSNVQGVESPHKAYQQKYRRMRLKQGSPVRMAFERSQSSSSYRTRLSNAPKQRLRFERPAPSTSNAQGAASPLKSYRQKYRRMRLKQNAPVRMIFEQSQGSGYHTRLSSAPKQRLRFERPATSTPNTQGAESPFKAYRQKYQLIQGSFKANTVPPSNTRLRFEQPARPSPTGLSPIKPRLRHSHYNGKIHATYTVWEETSSGRLLDNGEGRGSRLKFVHSLGPKLKFNKSDSTAPRGGGPPTPPGGGGHDLKNAHAKGKFRKGFFGGQSALSKEINAQLDKLAKNSDNEGVQAANQHRKWVTYGAREGGMAGKRWRNGEERRAAARAKKQQVRVNREKIYQQKHGKPSMPQRGRNWVTQRKFQVKRFAEKRMGAKNAQRAEKLIAFASRKLLQVIRLVITAIGGPVLGIVAVYIGMAAILLMMFGGFYNNAVVVLSSYAAPDATIEAASSYYTRLEAELDKEIKNVSTDWRWQHIDAFHYDLDDIGHDPFQLMAYLSVKYPGFTFSDVQTELDYMFDERYTLTYDEWYEWRGESPHRYKYYHLDVTLRSKPMEPILLRELAKDTTNDLVSWYGVLMETKGAHQAYSNPFDIDWSGNVSSLYGYRVDPIGGRELQQHRGLDIAMPTGTPIRAGLSGTVRYVGHDPVMGNYIIINADGVEHTMKYGHCDEVRVSAGDKVVAGETVIGTVGNTGQSTGPHLHLEILENGEYINPIYSLEFRVKT